jgi:hypothetical protein
MQYNEVTFDLFVSGKGCRITSDENTSFSDILTSLAIQENSVKRIVFPNLVWNKTSIISLDQLSLRNITKTRKFRSSFPRIVVEII